MMQFKSYRQLRKCFTIIMPIRALGKSHLFTLLMGVNLTAFMLTAFPVWLTGQNNVVAHDDPTRFHEVNIQVPALQVQAKDPTSTADKPPYPGIWVKVRGDLAKLAELDESDKPWLKGVKFHLDWATIESESKSYDWSLLDEAVNMIAAKQLYTIIKIEASLRSPDWIYEFGVPAYYTNFEGGTRFPYYFDGRYEAFVKRMIKRVSQHLQTAYSPQVRAKILAVQGPVGALGDWCPYKQGAGAKIEGAACSWGEGEYAIHEADWIEFNQEMFQFYHKQYQRSQPFIYPMFEASRHQEVFNWMVETLPGSWARMGAVGDRYAPAGSSFPGHVSNWMPEITGVFLPSGLVVRTFSDMDLTKQGWFLEAPLWNMYWTQLWGLHNHLDFHVQTTKDLPKTEYYAAFAFFSKYAGYKDPRDSKGVWIALRDGLDANDLERFPISIYGPKKSQERIHNIVAEFSRYGAQQSDPGTVTGNSRDGLNDVSMNVYPGNFQLYLYQINPNQTSQGLWRQGPQDEMYGRFARRFDSRSGKSRMYFDIDDGFFFDQPLEGQYPVTIRVVYLDVGTGSWKMKYDAVGNPKKLAFEVQKTDTGRWQEVTYTIMDGYFYNRGPQGSDLMLVNADDEDDTFHMIEITRESGFRTDFWGEK